MSCDAKNEDDMRKKARLLCLSTPSLPSKQTIRWIFTYAHVPAAILMIFGACPLKTTCLFLSVDSQ